MEVFNDNIMKATLMDNGWVCVEWLNNKIGYLSKTVVKDFHKVEHLISEKGYFGWMLGSEIENTNMHKLIEKFGGKLFNQDGTYVFYMKRIN